MANRLLELTENPSSALTNWQEIIAEIDREFPLAKTSGQRASLLAMFQATMNVAETTIAPEGLAKFRETRAKHYNTFIVEEALVGTNVCVETLDAVTQREVAAGRMGENHELRRGAVNGMAAPHHTRAELEALAAARKADVVPAVTGWRRLLGKLVGR